MPDDDSLQTNTAPSNSAEPTSPAPQSSGIGSTLKKGMNFVGKSIGQQLADKRQKQEQQEAEQKSPENSLMEVYQQLSKNIMNFQLGVFDLAVDKVKLYNNKKATVKTENVETNNENKEVAIEKENTEKMDAAAEAPPPVPNNMSAPPDTQLGDVTASLREADTAAYDKTAANANASTPKLETAAEPNMESSIQNNK